MREVDLPFLLGEGLQGVHGPDQALGHGEQEGPGLILGLEVAHKGFGDQGVFFPAVQERLVGNAKQNGDGGFHLLGQVHAE